MEKRQNLINMIKALADESRLTILRRLNEHEYSVGDLAERVNLSEPTVSHHLARLREVGLVALRMAGNQRYYRVNGPGLIRFKELVATIEQMPTATEPIQDDERWITNLGWSPEDQQVLREYGVNGQLTKLPSRQKKLIIILRWLATLFEANKLYSEPEVNAILKAVYETDYVGLRRDLVDFGYLRRERNGGKYWLTPADEKSPVDPVRASD